MNYLCIIRRQITSDNKFVDIVILRVNYINKNKLKIIEL